jgi:alpha-tubulin suppressor-like RCC1 family protein
MFVAACSEGTAPPAAVTVTGISPNNGPLVGGTAVTITGTNFPATVDSVRVGTARLGSLVRVSAAQLTGSTPAGTPGAVNVVVYTTSAGKSTCTGCFTYNPALTVTGVSPDNGPLAGGTAVTITGTDFPATVDSVRVGSGQLGNLVRVSGTQLTGTTPAGSATGIVDVAVYTTSAGSGTCTGCFTYYKAPVTWTGLTTGYWHNCGTTSGGAAYCWGDNWWGQLGDGSSLSSRTTLVAVAGGLTFASLTAGEVYTCGQTSDGAAYCWGLNDFGQLGDGSTTDHHTPGTAAGGLTFASLTAGGKHTCGLTSSGAAYCWGLNEFGQLGDGSTSTRLTPVAVASGLMFASLTAGLEHTCGLVSGGAAYCWGYNPYGGLGDGSTTNRTTPVPVAGGLTFVSLTPGGAHTCGLTSGGAAYCWGDNYYGELGDGSTTDRWTPVAVAGGLTFASLTAGWIHTCGRTNGGAAYCWGFNLYGGLGDGSTTNRTTPVPVAGGLTFASLTAGLGHTCGRTSGGAAYCWGYNHDGELGDGTTTDRSIPVAVVSP